MSHKGWTTAEKTIYFRMKEAGEPLAHIAARLGKTLGAVKTYDHRLRVAKYIPKVATPKVDSICWNCKNAVPNPNTGDGCNWSLFYEPVDGWTTDEKQNTERITWSGESEISYCVISCPEFTKG